MKTRKESNGLIRNKQRTKEKIITATETVFKEKGYTGLTTANITKEAGVNHTLIQKYFGSLEDLIEQYVKQNDFWQLPTNERINDLITNERQPSKFDIVLLLNAMFDKVFHNEELQKILLWELSEDSEIMKKIAEEREVLGEKLFSLLEENKDTKFDLRAMLAVQIAGLYYLSIHAKSNGSLFCGIDVNTPEGRQRIVKSMESVVDLMM
ncbi:MAG: TetR/AcrR family transcriptional regulator [Flavobacteriaceae bacterium]|nr:TetR/AcrR family transcriptional regulator [Flavobacteriaceae bacterium]